LQCFQAFRQLRVVRPHDQRDNLREDLARLFAHFEDFAEPPLVGLDCIGRCTLGVADTRVFHFVSGEAVNVSIYGVNGPLLKLWRKESRREGELAAHNALSTRNISLWFVRLTLKTRKTHSC
jgi:hypothetical protein